MKRSNLIIKKKKRGEKAYHEILYQSKGKRVRERVKREKERERKGERGRVIFVCLGSISLVHWGNFIAIVRPDR